MIQCNRRTLRGIIPLKVPEAARKSTFQPLMTTLLLALLRYCPFVTHVDLIPPYHGDGEYNESRVIPLRESRD
jgi:hypothetical protein